MEKPTNSARRRTRKARERRNTGKRRAKWKAPAPPRAKHRKLPSETALLQNHTKSAAHAPCYDFAASAENAARQTPRILARKRAARKNSTFPVGPRGPPGNTPKMPKPGSGPSAVLKNAPHKALQKHGGKKPDVQTVRPGRRFSSKSCSRSKLSMSSNGFPQVKMGSGASEACSGCQNH